jgi:hypothetical protein
MVNIYRSLMTSVTGVPAPVRRTCLRCASGPLSDDATTTTCKPGPLNAHSQQQTCFSRPVNFHALPTARPKDLSKRRDAPLPRFRFQINNGEECCAPCLSLTFARFQRVSKNVYKPDCYGDAKLTIQLSALVLYGIGILG